MKIFRMHIVRFRDIACSYVFLYRNRYRVDTLRKPGWDYAQPGSYFVTVCTRNRIPWFGAIRNGIMGLSDTGCIVADEIQRTPVVRPRVDIDRWIVMPNHVHMILHLQWDDVNTVEASRRDASTDVARVIPLFRPRPRSLGSIIQQWKCMCTKRIRAMGHPDFSWQPLFYDHIVHNDSALDAIRTYVEMNPTMWNRDRNHA